MTNYLGQTNLTEKTWKVPKIRKKIKQTSRNQNEPRTDHENRVSSDDSCLGFDVRLCVQNSQRSQETVVHRGYF